MDSRMTREVLHESLAPDDFFVVIDGGARNGAMDIAPFNEFSAVYCFEPSPEEFGRIRALSAQLGRGSVCVSPAALCGHDGNVMLNISARPGATSTLEPNAGYLRHYAADNWSGLAKIVDRVEVPCQTLATFLGEAGLRHVDLLKLDTQGNELDILRSLGDRIDDVEVIKTEVEMVPMYVGQPLFQDIAAYLVQRGFEFVDLAAADACRRFHSRADLDPSAYRLVWGDAIFVRRPYEFGDPRALHRALMLAALGYADLAIYMVRNIPALSTATRQKVEAALAAPQPPASFLGATRRKLERMFGLRISRHCWAAGKQVVASE